MIEKLIAEAREQASWDIPENTQVLLLKMADVLEKQMPEKPTTNYEHIKAMSADEMAEWLIENANPRLECRFCIARESCLIELEGDCHNIHKLWLESEAQEDA